MRHENSNGFVFTELQGALQTSEVKTHVLFFTGAVEGVLGADLPRRGGAEPWGRLAVPWSPEGGELSPPTCGTTLRAPGHQQQVQSEGSCLELSLCQRNVGGKYLVWRHLRGKFIGLEFHAHVRSPRGPCSLPARCPGAAPLVAGLYGALKLWGCTG